jgi:hypothetical protein
VSANSSWKTECDFGVGASKYHRKNHRRWNRWQNERYLLAEHFCLIAETGVLDRRLGFG